VWDPQQAHMPDLPSLRRVRPSVFTVNNVAQKDATGPVRVPHLRRGCTEEKVNALYIYTNWRSEVSRACGPLTFVGKGSEGKTKSYDLFMTLVSETARRFERWHLEGTALAEHVGAHENEFWRVLGEISKEGIDDANDESDDLFGDVSEDSIQLVDAILEKATTKAKDTFKCELWTRVKKAARTRSPQSAVRKILAELHDRVSHRIEAYVEILPRGDALAPDPESMEAAAERYWVWIISQEQTRHEYTLDDALRDLIQMNNTRTEESKRKDPVEFRSRFVSSIRKLHPDVTETVYLGLHDTHDGVAADVLAAIEQNRFTDSKGVPVVDLRDASLRRDFPGIGLDSLFSISQLVREPAMGGNDAQYTQYQNEPYRYIKGLFDVFPPDFEARCSDLEERYQVASRRHREAQLALHEARSLSDTDDLERLVSQEERRLGEKESALEERDTYHLSKWGDLPDKWYSRGITLAYMPGQVQQCMWQIMNLSTLSPPLTYTSFIGYWENLQRIRRVVPESAYGRCRSMMGGVPTRTGPAISRALKPTTIGDDAVTPHSESVFAV